MAFLPIIAQLLLRFWKPLAVIAVVIGLYGAGWHKGHAVAEAQCQAAALKAQLIETERQRREAESSLEAARKLNEEHNREIADLNSEAEAYVAQLQSGEGRCTLTDDDVRRLRALQ